MFAIHRFSCLTYVTHDQVEALTLADKIVVLNAGNIEQVGSPMELYNTPQNVFVAGFIGSPKMNFFEAEAKSNRITFKNGKSVDAPSELADGTVTVGLRPENVELANEDDALIVGKLELVEKLGEYALAYLTTQHGVSMTAKLEKPPVQKTGDTIYLKCDPGLLHVFDRASGKRV